MVLSDIRMVVTMWMLLLLHALSKYLPQTAWEAVWQNITSFLLETPSRLDLVNP